jgi:hypothetical protein
MESMVDKRTSRLIVRTSPEELMDWEAQAKTLDVTLADLVRARMARPAVDTRDDTLVRVKQRSDIEALEKALATAKTGAVPVLHRQIKTLEETIDVQAKKIAKLEEGIVQGLGRSSGPLPPAFVVPDGERPPMEIGGSLMGNPVAADPVPRAVQGEAHSFFKPSQRAALDVLGQAPAKGKGKR